MKQPHRPLWKTALAITAGLALLAGAACAPAADSAPEDTDLTVYASFYPMADFARRIAGDRATVHNLIPSAAEPHGWEPTAADMVALESADLFIYNGAGMERWAEDLLRALSPSEDRVVLEASEGLDLLYGTDGHEHGEADGEHEHDPDEGVDPHVWLSPVLALEQLRAIRDAFLSADPEGADVYRANYETHAVLFEDLDRQYRERLAPYSGQPIVVSHAAFGYLCHEYDLRQVPIEGLTPDGEPDPARITEILKEVEQDGIRVILFEQTASARVADMIAAEADVRTDVLSPVSVIPEEQQAAGADYLSVMKDNLDRLVRALEESQK